jgi:ABC-type phosphate/phosphonate transport system substrate-binding protein
MAGNGLSGKRENGLMKSNGLMWSKILSVLMIGVICPTMVNAEFKIVVMQDQRGEAKHYRSLLNYLNSNGVEASFVAARSYPQAAELFANESVDGMFSGSGIAGCMLIKDLAYPVARPVHLSGWSTYWAVVIGPKGSPIFTQDPGYFKGKRVIFCSLASSGEFYFHSITGTAKHGATLLKASSHGAALDALSRKAADIAIVKNRIWDQTKDKYPELIRLGEDPGENPDGTLIVAKHAETAVVEKLLKVLLNLETDLSPEAVAVKENLGIKGYLRTTMDDFKFTIPMLKKAGVDKGFNFEFQ